MGNMYDRRTGVVSGKYKPLYEHLLKIRQEGLVEWNTSFSEIERIIGKPLPESAYVWPILWSNLNQSGRASTAWFEAGWKVYDLDMNTRTLSFRLDKDTLV